MFTNDDCEPWLIRGGFTAELQRMLPLESAKDLFPSRPSDTANLSRVYTIRMFQSRDKEQLYQVCSRSSYRYRRRICQQSSGSLSLDDNDEDELELLGDRVLGAFLVHSPQYCFVLEDDTGICGYCVAALNVAKFRDTLIEQYLPLMRAKHSLRLQEVNSLEVCLPDLEELYVAGVPTVLATNYPSLLRLESAPSRYEESGVLQRLLACVCTALKSNGSPGIHVLLNRDEMFALPNDAFANRRITAGFSPQFDLYKSYGFVEMMSPDEEMMSDALINRLLVYQSK